MKASLDYIIPYPKIQVNKKIPSIVVYTYNTSSWKAIIPRLCLKRLKGKRKKIVLGDYYKSKRGNGFVKDPEKIKDMKMMKQVSLQINLKTMHLQLRKHESQGTI